MFLRNIWYFAFQGSDLKPGKMIHKKLLGEPVLFGRKKDGEVFALRDICPHRGVLLSGGRLLGPGDSAVGETVSSDQVECPYHGWRFGADGKCAAIPSLVPGQEIDVEKIRVQRYPVAEKNGLVWVFMPDAEDRPALTDDPETDIPLPLTLPGIELDHRPRMRDRIMFDCHIDNAVIGLMDPAHGPFVHQAWWWRTSDSIHQKAKEFTPSELGFTMVAHEPSSNSAGYKLLGGKPVTEIAFRLPGIRTELITVGKHKVLGLTTVTPIDEDHTEVTQTFFWTNPMFNFLKLILIPMGRAFLRQDHRIVMMQKEGLQYNPRLMLINDADVQAKWYYRLKKAWDDAQTSGEAFTNPVQPATLHWRS